jgi:hypothetical protein
VEQCEGRGSGKSRPLIVDARRAVAGRGGLRRLAMHVNERVDVRRAFLS